MATVYEWKYEEGYIWIAEKDGEFRVWIDPTDFDKFYTSLTSEDWHDLRVTSSNIHNTMSNCEASEGSAPYEQVMWVWKKMGSPRINRKAPGHAVPVWTGSLYGLEDEHERAASAIEKERKIPSELLNIYSNWEAGDEHFEHERQAKWIENNPEPAALESE